jgi:hypothetical protein
MAAITEGHCMINSMDIPEGPVVAQNHALASAAFTWEDVDDED